MKPKRYVAILFFAGTCVAFNTGAASSQSTPSPGKGSTQMKNGERTGEEKMEARGAQEAGRMETERKKGEVEMEARGAQKPGRMEKTGAEQESAGSSGHEWTTEDIKKAQQALKSKGHDPGSIDGTLGPQTRRAISAFQKASGLKETGSLDAETANQLGMQKGSGSTSSTERETSSTESKGATSPTPKEPSSAKGQ